jgi:hypothetical protein
MGDALRALFFDGERRAVRTSTWLALLLLAALHTLGNVAKPLHIDDAAYYYYARQAADHPLDPYDFQMFWWSNPEPANEVLAPPLLPYWWSLALHLDGDHPWVWKLAMVPFSLLFIGSLYALFRRFARGLELPLVWLTVLSPTFWPSMNLMLDIPALALSLCALILFMRACDLNAFGLAALSGLFAGIAMETKYTAFLTPAAMLLFAVFSGRLRVWPPAALAAISVFVSWEAVMAVFYGESHFLYHYRNRGGVDWIARFSLLLPLLGVLGSLTPALVLLTLKGLRIPWPFVAAIGLLGTLGYALVAFVKDTDQTRLYPPLLFADLPTDRPYLTFQEALFGAWGLVLACLVLFCIGRLLRFWPYRPRRFQRLIGESFPIRWIAMGHIARMTLFLALWLGLEIAGYVALTPFVAVRRVMGIVIVCTLIAGCMAARSCRDRRGSAVVWCITAYSAVLGLGFTALDWREAQAEQEGVERAAAWLNEHGEGGTVWYVGHWGFQFYAERAGMEPVSPVQSELLEGDYLVYPYWITKQSVDLDGIPCTLVEKFEVDDAVPLQTVMCYYSGNTAIENRDDRRLTVYIYRITERCVPGYRKRH